MNTDQTIHYKDKVNFQLFHYYVGRFGLTNNLSDSIKSIYYLQVYNANDLTHKMSNPGSDDIVRWTQWKYNLLADR